MKLVHFQHLRPAMQVRFVLTRGTHLLHRLAQAEAFSLYHLADTGKGFFVEVTYIASRNETVVVRSFTNAGPLEEYLVWLPLPALSAN